MGRYAPEYTETNIGSYGPEMEYALSRVLLPPPVEQPAKEGDATQLYKDWYPKMFTSNRDTIIKTSEDVFPELVTGEKFNGPDDDVDKLYSPWYLVTPSHEKLPQLGSGEKFTGPHPTEYVDDVDQLYGPWYIEVPSEEKLPHLGAGVKYMGPDPTDVDTLYSQGYPDMYNNGAHGQDIIDNKLKQEDAASNMIFDFGKQFLKIKNKF